MFRRTKSQFRPTVAVWIDALIEVDGLAELVEETL